MEEYHLVGYHSENCVVIYSYLVMSMNIQKDHPEDPNYFRTIFKITNFYQKLLHCFDCVTNQNCNFNLSHTAQTHRILYNRLHFLRHDPLLLRLRKKGTHSKWL